MIPRPYSRERIEDLGSQAFYDGVAREDNPFNYSSHSAGGPMKAAWWSAGWAKAQAGEPKPRGKRK